MNPTPAISTPALAGISQRTRNHVTRHLMPFLFLVYVVAYIDRNNIGFAGLQMTGELGFSDSVFGLGSGIFFAGYTILGIPGAMLVEKWSARRTLAATMFVWGLVASATGFIHTQTEFYSMRFLLGVAEAAFFPGIITYLGHWYRLQDRAKAVAMFMAAIPVSQAIAAPLSAGLMKVHWMGLSGWRWLLILEGVPAIVCAVVSMLYLTDRPRDAHGSRRRSGIGSPIIGAREQEENDQRKMSFWNALAHKDVLLLCLVYFGGTVGNYGLNLWMPKIIQKLAHLSVTDTALVSAIPAIAAIPLMFLCGWHSDKTGERRWHTALPRVIAGLAMAVSDHPRARTGCRYCSGSPLGLPESWRPIRPVGDPQHVPGKRGRRGEHRADQLHRKSGWFRGAVRHWIFQRPDGKFPRRIVGHGGYVGAMWICCLGC